MIDNLPNGMVLNATFNNISVISWWSVFYWWRKLRNKLILMQPITSKVIQGQSYCLSNNMRIDRHSNYSDNSRSLLIKLKCENRWAQ